jgi:hypothetical protein
LIGGADAESVTATCVAVLALSGLDGSAEIERSVRNGVAMLVGAVLDDDPRAEPLYASAQIVQVLARPDISVFGGPRAERAKEHALARVTTHLQRGTLGIEEEVFVREGVTDIWRHMTLHLSLAAQAEAAPELIFEPAFRRGLIEMLELQECGADNVNFGGFRTSREGFVTSYATTQALHALASINMNLNEQVNPGSAFDLLCRSAGTHHSDPQDVMTIARRTVVMNSGAGALILLASCIAALTTSALTIDLKNELGDVASGMLLLWSAIFVAAGAFAFSTVRWPDVSNGRIALRIFTAFSAVLLPIVLFFFS